MTFTNSLIRVENILLRNPDHPKLGQAYKDDWDHGYDHAADNIKFARLLVPALSVSVDWDVLLTAIYLHDLFVIEAGPSHGGMAADFFQKNFSHHYSRTQANKIIEAILLHDDKTSTSAAQREKASVEAQILYDVDNVTAFGYKGIYRYIITYYMKRNDGLHNILPNVLSRYKNLIFKQELYPLIQKDYEIIRDFFSDWNDEKQSIVDFIIENSKQSPYETAQQACDQFQNPTIRDFFIQLSQAYGLTPREI